MAADIGRKADHAGGLAWCKEVLELGMEDEHLHNVAEEKDLDAIIALIQKASRCVQPRGGILSNITD